MPVIGSLVDFRRDMLGFLAEVARRYGDVAAFRLGPTLAYLVSEPREIERILVESHRSFVKSRGLERMKPLFGEGLLTSEGAFHLRQRRMVQPAFHQRRLAEYGTTMAAYANRRQRGWRPGITLDAAEEMRVVTLEIAGKTLFGAELEEETEEIGEALTSIMELFPRLLLPFSELLERLPIPSTRRFEREKGRLDRIVYRLIRERRAEGHDRGDVLSLLLAAEEDEPEGGGATGREAEVPTATGGRRTGRRSAGDVRRSSRMTDRQVRDEVLTLLLAGHETTANALAWSWYLLARNPGAEAEFHREVDRVLGGRLPGTDDVSRLPFTRAVLAESMRLFPPAWMVGRRALEDREVGGYVLPEGGVAFMSQWVVHRDPRWWPDPLRFDPGRWLAEERPERDRDPEASASSGTGDGKGSVAGSAVGSATGSAARPAASGRTGERPRFAYFPFGGGPRLCIGEGFAWMEGVLVLATVARRWRLRLAPDHRTELLPRVTLRPRHGVRMVPERR